MIRNTKFGFGKFTPADSEALVCHAIMMFAGDEMLNPSRLYKADEENLRRAEQAANEEALV